MIPVMQTKFGEGKGDCYAACLASILEAPIDKVPNFCAEYKDWWQKTLAWLKDRGYWAIMIDGVVDYPGYWIASGIGPRGGVWHSVVYKNEELVHDPHPDGSGLVEVDGVVVRDSIVLVPVDLVWWRNKDG